MPHRGVSAVRVGRRFTPYQAADNLLLKPHASCSAITSQELPILFVSSPEDSSLDTCTEISSTATLVNPSFETDKWDCPSTPLLAESQSKTSEKHSKAIRSSLQQKKSDYVSCLIDFACTILNESWSTPDIPAVFRYQHGATFGYTKDTSGAALDDFKPRPCLTDLIHIRKFVTELLRRSRSTCSTLQSALCYMEAIRNKVVLAQEAEQQGNGSRGDDVSNEGRIQIESDSNTSEEHCESTKSSGMPLPQLPSPLLCPRRVFMASLVLAAKFVQDKCYSNRAWAKLCGLPPREVSRCERAVGDALEWRLWVGKGTNSPFARLESKLGLAPIMMASYPAVEDRKDVCAEKMASKPLARAHTWPAAVELTDAPTTCLTIPETDFTMSPTPSLSSSGSSICSSGSLSPFYPSPSPMFVPNDPCPAKLVQSETMQLRLSDFLKDVAFGISQTTYCSDQSYLQQQDVFGIRVADGIEVV